mmetsp:Transcript_14519/g.29335  ORF Transcript_14519/g.29335 Transcript_14519/m.29335 type:complete len:234 (+) Transcript_14519:1311-2012(+)
MRMVGVMQRCWVSSHEAIEASMLLAVRALKGWTALLSSSLPLPLSTNICVNELVEATVGANSRFIGPNIELWRICCSLTEADMRNMYGQPMVMMRLSVRMYWFSSSVNLQSAVATNSSMTGRKCQPNLCLNSSSFSRSSNAPLGSQKMTDGGWYRSLPCTHMSLPRLSLRSFLWSRCQFNRLCTCSATGKPLSRRYLVHRSMALGYFLMPVLYSGEYLCITSRRPAWYSQVDT